MSARWPVNSWKDQFFLPVSRVRIGRNHRGCIYGSVLLWSATLFANELPMTLAFFKHIH